MRAEGQRAEDWHPSREVILVWSILGVVLSLAGIISFAATYAFARGEDGGTVEISLLALVIPTLVVFVVLGVYEWIHGLTMACFGARPACAHSSEAATRTLAGGAASILAVVSRPYVG